MISVAFATGVLVLMLYVHQSRQPLSLRLWRQVLEHHPSMRVVAARNIQILEGHRRVLGWAILVQGCVVAALGYLVVLRHLVRYAVAAWGGHG